MTSAGDREDFFVGAAVAGPPEKRIAFGVLLAALLTFLALAPFARLHLAKEPAVVPAYGATLFVCNLLTSALLFGQFVRVRTLPVLIIATGFLFAALISVAHMASFPGVFTPQGLLGSSPQITSWIYSLWHGGFPLFILAYGAARRRRVALRPEAALAVAAAAAALLVLASVGAVVVVGERLPILIVNGADLHLVAARVSPVILAICVAAVAVLLRRKRLSILDLWLLVVLGAWMCDVCLSAVIGSERFSLGWYGGRMFGLLAATFVLAALLLEMNQLYARLRAAVDEVSNRNEELVRSRAELARSQRLEALGELTGGVAHDFNNLLMAIVGGLDVIIRNASDQERVLKMADIAMRSSERGIHLVRQLLTFSRHQNLRPEVVGVNALLLEFESLARAAAGDKVDLKLDLQATGDLVRIDVGEFQAALLNLISNAKDAMKAGGVLVIATADAAPEPAGGDEGAPEQGRARLSVTVSDTGSGMDEATQAKAFEPFFTTKDVGQGTGLGLSQVYGFTRGAGGEVTVSSILGVGTTIKMALPKSDEAAVPSPSSEIPIGRATRGETVLVVEDDEVVMQATRETLRDLGYTVLAAPDASAALTVLEQRETHVDVLFSDVVMPGKMNGVELAHIARSLRPDLKVLLTSGFTRLAPLSAPAGGGAEPLPLIGKPYRQEELATKLRGVLAEP